MDTKSRLTPVLYGTAILAASVLLSDAAMAQQLGNVVANTGRNLINIPNVISVIAYSLGAAAIVMAGQKFKQHADHPNQTPLTAGVVRLFTGGALMGFPSIARMLVNTLGVNNPLVQQGYGIAASTATDKTLDVLLTNFIANIQTPLIGLISFIAYILGAWLILRGLLKSVRYADDGPKGQPGMGIVSHLAVGAVLMALPAFMSQISNTLQMTQMATFSSLQFGTSGVDPAAQAKANAAAKAVFAFIQIIGLIGFIRGINMLRVIGEGGQQNASMPAAITHIIGGAIAWNIITFIRIISDTVGLTGANGIII